MSRNEDPHIDE